LHTLAERLTTINDIARSFDISKAHLMKVVNDLSQMGYLDTVRGRSGGIRLLREPRDIIIGQVVRDTEDPERTSPLTQTQGSTSGLLKVANANTGAVWEPPSDQSDNQKKDHGPDCGNNDRADHPATNVDAQ
jgi:Rrf2 family protein